MTRCKGMCLHMWWITVIPYYLYRQISYLTFHDEIESLRSMSNRKCYEVMFDLFCSGYVDILLGLIYCLKKVRSLFLEIKKKKINLIKIVSINIFS